MIPTVWLASYPKSGNTWFRILVANLWSDRDEPIDINAIDSSDAIASARNRFDQYMLVDSGLLRHDEIDRMRPALYAHAAAGGMMADPDEDPRVPVRFVKTHDAYTLTDDDEPLLGGSRGAAGAILFVRDPRDVAPSLANHLNRSIDEAIATMGDCDFAFARKIDRQDHQLRQRLLDWSGFAATWLDQADIPVHLVRYEDMIDDTEATVHAALAFAGIHADPARLDRAIAFAAIDELQRQEAESGFYEAPKAAVRFFRRGVAGGWRDELSRAQIDRIERDHAGMMARLGYAVSSADDGANGSDDE